MISFACKQVDIKDIVMCSFELNKTEYLTLNFLLTQENLLSISDVAKRMRKERSTIQKAMKSLFEKDLVSRRQINLEQGGYQYRYAVRDKDDIQLRLIGIVKGWEEQVRKAIKAW